MAWGCRGLEIVVMLDQDEIRHGEAGRLLVSLDLMGFGEWVHRHIGGGCQALACTNPDGSYVLVTGVDVLGRFCDPQEFHGVVTVGVYRSEASYIDGDESLMFEVRDLVGGSSVESISEGVYDVLAGWANW